MIFHTEPRTEIVREELCWLMKLPPPSLISQGWRHPRKGRGSAVLSLPEALQKLSPPATEPFSQWERDSDSFLDSALTASLGGVGVSILFRGETGVLPSDTRVLLSADCLPRTSCFSPRPVWFYYPLASGPC